MLSRREFLIMSAGTALVASFPTLANTGAKPQTATAITQVFGNGVRLTAIAIEYSQPVTSGQFDAKDFSVEGRTITNVFVSNSASLDKAESGKFVIVQLSPDDANLSLSEMIPMANATVRPKPAGGGKPWVAGDKPATNLIFNWNESRSSPSA
ncbi:hypothetical protein KZ357_01975, partial [Glaesserella parasuis]|nr:hypothetical protein [Glaesserella parasuis]